MESDELARMRRLFDELESQEGLIELLGDADNADGVASSSVRRTSCSRCPLIGYPHPYRDANEKITACSALSEPTRSIRPHRAGGRLYGTAISAIMAAKAPQG